MFRSWMESIVAVVIVLVVGVLGVVVGVNFREQILNGIKGSPAPAAATGEAGGVKKERKVLYWQDAMYNPPYISDKPGKSPMGMDLEPVYEDQVSAGPRVTIDPVIVQNMGVRVAPVQRGDLKRTIRTVGTFTEPEQNHVEVNLRVSGWIEKLYANQENVEVRKGQPLFEFYSPEITAAADELITARKSAASMVEGGAGGDEMKGIGAAVLAAARRKLELLGLDAKQIDELEKLDKSPRTVTFFSPMTGHVTEKAVIEGAAVKAGERVMKIADRSSMWLLVQVYERDLEFVTVGTKVRTQVAAFAGETFEGPVEFVYPHLDMMNRTATVRVVFANPGHRLHEGMYATVQVVAVAAKDALLVPREAVIDSGEQQVALVAECGGSDGHFEPRKVTLGASGTMGDENSVEMVQVLTGLSPSDVVVTSGQFLLDSESRRRETLEKMRGGRVTAATSGPGSASAAMQAQTAVATDVRVDATIRAYLDIAEFLGTEEGEKTADVAGLDRAARELIAATEGDEKTLAAAVAKEAAALNGLALDKQREQFKAVSVAVIALAQKVGPTSAVAQTLYQFHCPMAKADWLQKTDKMANPYLPDMRECGMLVKKISTGAYGGDKGTPGGGK